MFAEYPRKIEGIVIADRQRDFSDRAIGPGLELRSGEFEAVIEPYRSAQLTTGVIDLDWLRFDELDSTLAQVAFENSDAYTALFEQAVSNKIPQSMWPRIALTLAGDYRFQLRKPENGRSTHVPIGRSQQHTPQILYLSRGGLETLSWEEKQVRLTLVRELLAVSDSPQAIDALESVHAMLAQSTL